MQPRTSRPGHPANTPECNDNLLSHMEFFARPALARSLQTESQARAPQRHSRFPASEIIVLYYAVVYFIVALIAALVGFGGIAAGAAGIAKILFIIFLLVSVVTFMLSLARK